MDSILIVGKVEDKIVNSLQKMGYEVNSDLNDRTVAKYIESKFVDLLIVSSKGTVEPVSACIKLRDDPATKRLPILFMSDSGAEIQALKDYRLDRIDYLDSNVSLGGLISKVATLIRLRKMVGADKGNKPNLSEVNAHLRDLTEKHKRELDDARGIQQTLLPKEFPQSPEFQIETCYIPLEELGGDWYYVQKVAEGKISILIADVTGHGLSAAFVGAMTKMAMVATNKSRPDELLKGMNQLMTPQMPPGRFVTMGACLYDPKTGQVDFCRAGHPPAFVLSRVEGKVKELMAGGLAIGFFDEGDYAFDTCTLAKDDVLVLITDGISEAQSRSLDQYGHERVKEFLLTTNANDSAKEISAKLINSFLAFTEGRILKDDVTVIVLKRTL